MFESLFDRVMWCPVGIITVIRFDPVVARLVTRTIGRKVILIPSLLTRLCRSVVGG